MEINDEYYTNSQYAFGQINPIIFYKWIGKDNTISIEKKRKLDILIKENLPFLNSIDEKWMKLFDNNWMHAIPTF